jgi:two-component system cell cycle sensor histidine kinase/response regulator CckA
MTGLSKGENPSVVLVADDDLTVRMLVRASLEPAGFKVEELADGIQVISSLNHIRPDIILLDVMMPEMDGFEVCAALQRLPEEEQIPVVMMTGLDDFDSINRAYEIGATDFITKPINWANLPHRIHYILRAKQAFEGVRRLAHEMAIMAEIGQIISSTLHIDAVYENFAKAVAKLIPFDRISINIINPKENTITPTYILGLEVPNRLKGDIIPLAGTTTERIFKTNSPFIIQMKELLDIVNEFPALEPSFRSGIRSTIAVPLISNDQVIGSLLLGSVKEQAYTEDSLRIANKVGSQISGAIANAQLISERNRAESEAKILEEQLHQAQKMEVVGQLAGGIAHDFNNSLTLIKVCSQLALQELKEGDPVRDKIQQIDEATQRSGNLARQLLTFSRRQASEMKILDLNCLLTNLNKMLARVIGEDIELATKMADDLGRIKADPGQIEQIIVNLTVNAKDAMPNGGKLVLKTANVELNDKFARAHIHMAPGPYTLLSVTDTGHGMTPEIKEHIFEPFFTTKEKGKGTGLGLFMVYGIVQKHGGHILVDSEQGAGTRFEIYWPQVDDKIEAGREEMAGKSPLPGGETVLVVEDDGDLRKIIAQALAGRGYNTLEAANAHEGLVLFDKNRQEVNLVVTDIVMPMMSGFELADILLPLCPQMKVLYMSGYQNDVKLGQGVLNPEVNFIAKPFSVEDLARKVRSILDN